jgi:hypothetical protein
VVKLDRAGQVRAASAAADTGGVRGRLAIHGGQSTPPAETWIAAGYRGGSVAVFDGALQLISPAWPKRLGTPGEPAPGLLWIVAEPAAQPLGPGPRCGTATRVLVVQRPLTLHAFCPGGEALAGWGQTAGDPLIPALAAGDVDGDGYAEVVTLTTTSKLALWDAGGFPAPGWPRATTREGFASGASPLAADVDGDGVPEMVVLNGSGILVAFRAGGQLPSGWPLASGVGATGSPCFADLNLDGKVEIVAPDLAGRIWAYSVPGSSADPQASPWPMLGGDPGRSFAVSADREPPARALAGDPLLTPGSLKAYPNPARLKPVSFAFRLTDPGEVEFTILDTSGHQVARFAQPAMRADNVVRWDPGGLPAGLYMARLRFSGAGKEQVEVVPLGILR